MIVLERFETFLLAFRLDFVGLALVMASARTALEIELDT